ncbi:hypothetical protein MLD38_001671 [Melastoma candidum]|uniref:Uncharacterized protein n=1 Tax=Melastoma candidum TaxID=119954 RepID=A0ACB9SDY9_9MYRT|nr:hypothetical protein MLD38_001671 [Melastoma candidum]
MASRDFVANGGNTSGSSGRITAAVAITCIVAATSGLIFGYDIGISGGVTTMVPFLSKFFPSILRNQMEAKTNMYCMYNSQILTFFTSSMYIAALIASLAASRLTAALGRKNVMLLGGCTFLTGAAIKSGAVNIPMLILGRILLGAGVGLTTQVALTIVLGITTGTSGTGHIPRGDGILVVVLMCVYSAGFGWSWGPLGILIPSEIFPLRIRMAGQSISVAVSFAVTFIISQTFLSMLCLFKYWAFIFYGGWIAVMTIFVMILLPETKGIPIDELHVVWKRHWFWRRFV